MEKIITSDDKTITLPAPVGFVCPETRWMCGMPACNNGKSCQMRRGFADVEITTETLQGQTPEVPAAAEVAPTVGELLVANA